MLHKLGKFKGLLLVGVVLLFGGILAGCSQKSSSTSNGKVKITATTDFYGEVARAVAGNKGDVTSIINNPNVDPHDYDPTTAVAKNLVGSKIIIANGIGYDGWMNKLVNSNSQKSDYIKVGEDLMNKQNGDNPHLWYNPKTMPKLANTLASKLGKLQPKNKAYFKDNAQKYIKSLKPVNAKIAQLKALAAKSKNKQVYVSEPVFDYALTAIGFKVGNPKFENDTEKDVDPSPQVIRQMQNGIRNKKIRFFVFNKQVDDKTVNNLVSLAKKNNIPVLPVTETLPKGQDYVQWMDHQYNELLSILK